MKNGFWEGAIIDSEENTRLTADITGLRTAFYSGVPLEAKAFSFDREKRLIVPLCRGITGIIPYDECALGLDDGSAKEISVLSRVGKPVRFVVTGFYTLPDGRAAAQLSRRAVQRAVSESYLSALRPGDIIECRVTHVRQFCCFVDIGAGISALLPVDAISVSRISHPAERIAVGDVLRCVVRARDEQGRILLSLKELLGTWKQNAELFSQGETVTGIVRSVLDYGVFIELTPNLSGLSEPWPGAEAGMSASVYIKSIVPERMKIKLSLIDCFRERRERAPFRYFIESSHIDSFVYSPPECAKEIVSVFN